MHMGSAVQSCECCGCQRAVGWRWGLAVVNAIGACSEVLDAKLAGQRGGVLISCLYGWECQYVGELMGHISNVLVATR